MNIEKSILRGLVESEMSKSELAKELGISPTSVSRILKDKSCSIHRLQDFAEIFSVKVHEFIRWGEG